MTEPGVRLVLLGTAGGPLPSPQRAGISQAVVIGDRVFVVDCGSGVTRQLRRARLLRQLERVFVTHLHSDHDCDLFNLFLLGWPVLQWNPPVRIYGPASATRLPPDPPDRPGEIAVVNPANPVPGLHDLLASEFAAHAYDINVRMREAGRSDLRGLLVPHEIDPSAVPGASPEDVAPEMAPLTIHEDDDVRVTAVLVDHAPVFPSFAFRFDTDHGAIAISGDTAPCANLVALARGADVLVHEVFADDAGPADAIDSWEARRRAEHLASAHTSLSAVGKVAAEAGVEKLVLTHFIPGDDALPDDYWLGGIDAAFTGETIVGHDLMEIAL